ncbi:MAG: hypothetical protein HRU19_11460 [Pseudobacteriovorax sp.]|nr:hypothetical protein [Pseudobacteriovorax sp.]
MSSDERKFIHDICNPLAIAQGNVKLIIRKLKKNSISDLSEVLERLDKAAEAFDRVDDLIEDRREWLKSQQDQS